MLSNRCDSETRHRFAAPDPAARDMGRCVISPRRTCMQKRSSVTSVALLAVLASCDEDINLATGSTSAIVRSGRDSPDLARRSKPSNEPVTFGGFPRAEYLESHISPERIGRARSREFRLPPARDRAPLGTQHDDCSSVTQGRGCRGYDARAYRLATSIDWTAKQAVSRERIDLVLDDPNKAVIELDANVDIQSISRRGVELAYEVDADAELLWVDTRVDGSARRRVRLSIEFVARESAGLIFADPPATDPNRGRTMFTHSEPDRGKDWLVANHTASDRARFSVEVDVDRSDNVVANGRRVSDRVCGDRRTVRYAFWNTAPTYTMAFAAGKLEVVRDRSGPIALELWHRPGLLVDHDEHFLETKRVLTEFQAVLGPYPWRSYAVVLLPQFPGAMENVGVSFVSENLHFFPAYHAYAHELAHQWFGDLVTIATPDDLWIKEGLATLLALDALRHTHDEQDTGSFLGALNYYNPADAIVDRELQGLEKYTTGPYGKAAWLLTQIRASIGEDAFFGILRTVLRKYRFDAIGTDAFVEEFRDALGDKRTDQFRRVLELHSGPEAYADAVEIEGGYRVEVGVDDPERTLLDPVELTMIDAKGRASQLTLGSDESTVLEIEHGGYFAPDERGVHTNASMLLPPEVAFPASRRALRVFTRRSPTHQAIAMWATSGTFTSPKQFSRVARRLDGVNSRMQAELQACDVLATITDEKKRRGWIRALEPLLRMPHEPWIGLPYGSCGVDTAWELFGDEFLEMSDNLTGKSLPRWIYLLAYDYGPSTMFEILAPIAREPTAEASRYAALYRLTGQVLTPSFSPIPADDTAKWLEFFRDMLDRETDFSLHWRLERAIEALEA
ncbi:MAG: M1 family metallopeptidase [Myxococcales bacterium FL481]|nr:MAG: M1 family metallopeptidase [Myxococcales bacterium FL481]